MRLLVVVRLMNWIKLMTYYSILIEITLPDLYNPPNGTPPAAAAVSSAKFNDWETWVKIINPSGTLFAL